MRFNASTQRGNLILQCRALVDCRFEHPENGFYLNPLICGIKFRSAAALWTMSISGAILSASFGETPHSPAFYRSKQCAQ